MNFKRINNDIINYLNNKKIKKIMIDNIILIKCDYYVNLILLNVDKENHYCFNIINFIKDSKILLNELIILNNTDIKYINKNWK